MLKNLFALSVLLVLAACGGGGGDSLGMASSGPVEAAALKADAAPPPTTTLVPGDVLLVNTTTAGNQGAVRIGATADGGYTVAWLSGTSQFIQHYDRKGLKSGGETLVSGTGAVAVLADGGVVQACCGEPIVPGTEFQRGQAGRTDLTATRFDPGGNFVQQIQVAFIDQPPNPLFLYRFFADVKVLGLPDGGFVVGWVVASPSRIGVTHTLYVRRYDSQGEPVTGPAIGFSALGPPYISYSLAADAQGGFTVTVVVPRIFQQSPESPLTYTPLTSVFHFDAANTETRIIAERAGGVLLLPLEGDRYVLFTSDASGSFRQFLDSAGNAVGDPTPIPGMPFDAIELADGSFVVFWNVSGYIMAQRFDSDGAAAGDLLTVTSHALGPVVTALVDGGFALAWSGPNAGGDTDVFTVSYTDINEHAALRLKRKACLANARGMVGQERKAFMDACLA